jgi:DNA-binding transcriptional LysR family regulator
MRLRGLDIDDLFILGIMAEGLNMTGAAKFLNLSQAAVSQRMKKMTILLDCEIVTKSGVERILTAQGAEIAKAAREALIVLDRSLPSHDGSGPITFCN